MSFFWRGTWNVLQRARVIRLLIILEDRGLGLGMGLPGLIYGNAIAEQDKHSA
jgi:hypothetical protein